MSHPAQRKCLMCGCETSNRTPNCEFCGETAEDVARDALSGATLVKKQNAKLRSDNERLKRVLGVMSDRIESLIQREPGVWLPDHACEECVPWSAHIQPGFRCCRHAALALVGEE